MFYFIYPNVACSFVLT